jgi:hypothetical protein
LLLGHLFAFGRIRILNGQGTFDWLRHFKGLKEGSWGEVLVELGGGGGRGGRGTGAAAAAAGGEGAAEELS